MRSFWLVLFSLVFCFSSSAIEVDISDWKRLESILETLKTDNAKLQSLLTISEQALTESQTELTKAQGELMMLKQSLAEMQTSLEKLKISLQNTSDETLFGVIVAVSSGLTLGIILGGVFH